MDADEVLTELGGVATRAELLERITRADLTRAVKAGTVIRHARGRYALASVDEAAATAHRLAGTLCLTSAALHHGWAVKTTPEIPHLVITRGRRLAADQLGVASFHRMRLSNDDTAGIATTKEATLRHCLRTLPEDEALAIADSALRDGEEATLRRVAASARGAGAARVRRLAGLADGRAANPFESVGRWLALQVEGLTVEPQRLITSITPWAKPDLVDEDLGIVIECDSFEWHGDRAALRKDCRRYDQLVVDGWIVLRFAWEDVMFDADFVLRIMRGAVALAEGRTKVRSCRCGAA